MNLNNLLEQKSALIQLGKVLNLMIEHDNWPGYSCGVEEQEFLAFKLAVKKASAVNPWFSHEMISNSLKAWCNNFTEENLDKWLDNYSGLNSKYNKTVLIICAGNLPMVGWHDILCCFISGYSVKVKLSSDDDILIPAIVSLLQLFYPEIKNRVHFLKSKPENYDLVIATGSNNSNRYFNYYFGDLPHIFRNNRTSIAVLDHSTTKTELENLADDIFQYYGLGCRSVTKLYLPEGYDIDKLFKSVFKYKNVINHNKYMNNYDYNRSIYLLQSIKFLDNGFLILKECEDLFSPVSVVNYEFYKDLDNLEDQIKLDSSSIQCRVGVGGIPFGSAQKPNLWDYADGLDTINFLNEN